jgi:hypothetical protein
MPKHKEFLSKVLPFQNTIKTIEFSKAIPDTPNQSESPKLIL